MKRITYDWRIRWVIGGTSPKEIVWGNTAFDVIRETLETIFCSGDDKEDIRTAASVAYIVCRNLEGKLPRVLTTGG